MLKGEMIKLSPVQARPTRSRPNAVSAATTAARSEAGAEGSNGAEPWTTSAGSPTANGSPPHAATRIRSERHARPLIW